MIASSTTMPNTRMKPNRLIELMVTSTPGIGNIMNAPKNATGKPMITHVAIFMCRKMLRIANTITAPIFRIKSVG